MTNNSEKLDYVAETYCRTQAYNEFKGALNVLRPEDVTALEMMGAVAALRPAIARRLQKDAVVLKLVDW